MAVADEIAAWADGQIATIELENAGAVTSIAALAPTYEVAGAGLVDLAAPLEFSGPANGAITHVRFNKVGGEWFNVAIVGAPRAFNSDGRFDLESAPLQGSDNVTEP